MFSIYTSLKNKSHILVTAERIAETLLLGMAFYYLEMGIEIDSSILQSIYFSKAGIVFCTLIILIRKPPIFKIWNILYGLVGILTPFLYLKFAGYTRENSGFALNFMYYRGVEQFMFVWLLLDSIRLRKELKEQKYRWWYIIVFFLAIAIICVYDKERIYPLWVPTFAFFLTPIKKEKWIELTKSISIAYYAVFLVVVTGSLIENPHNSPEGRYLGSFGNYGSEGEFTAIAFFMMLYLVITFLKKEGKTKLLALVPGIFSLAPLSFLIYIECRGSQLAVLFLLALLLFLFIYRKSKFMAFGSVVIFVALVIVGFFVLRDISTAYSQSMKEANIQFGEIGYWKYKIAMAGNLDEGKSIFEKGSTLYFIDRLSSGRLNFWVEYLKDITPWGVEKHFILSADGWVAQSPHNYFVYWLYRFGYVLGSLVSACFLTCVIFLIKRNHQDKWLSMSFLIIVGGIPFMFFGSGYESQLWVILLLILQYPMMVCMEEAKGKDGCEN